MDKHMKIKLYWQHWIGFSEISVFFFLHYMLGSLWWSWANENWHYWIHWHKMHYIFHYTMVVHVLVDQYFTMLSLWVLFQYDVLFVYWQPFSRILTYFPYCYWLIIALALISSRLWLRDLWQTYHLAYYCLVDWTPHLLLLWLLATWLSLKLLASGGLSCTPSVLVWRYIITLVSGLCVLFSSSVTLFSVWDKNNAL